MVLLRRSLAALAISVLTPMLSGTALAGGGVGGGGIGGGIGGGGVVLSVDHTGPQNHNYGYLDYFSRTVTVHQGDAVTWSWAPSSEPHTVTLLPANVPLSDQAFGRLFPGAGGGPDKDDGANAPPAFDFNSNMQAACGNSPYYPATGPCSFTGTTILNSGVQGPKALPPSPSPDTYSIRVNARPGIYHYICLVHGPHMSGTIRVVARGAPVDTQAAINARAAKQWQTATTHAVTFESHLHAHSQTVNGHTVWTAFTGSGYGRVAINEFIPQNLPIKAGDTVNWTPGFHTVTFPASAPLPPFGLQCEAPGKDLPYTGSYARCAGLEIGLSPKSDFPSGQAGAAYSGGFYNSGIMVIPKPRPWSASFPKAGAFKYRCLVHPGMIGSISVG